MTPLDVTTQLISAIHTTAHREAFANFSAWLITASDRDRHEALTLIRTAQTHSRLIFEAAEALAVAEGPKK